MRRSSCCTSSEYCYHTDSTSLYGSRSSLSRNNSIKSASATLRRKKTHHREPSYSSMSLGRLNDSNPNSTAGSLTSIFEKSRDAGSGKMILSPSKVTIEHQSKTPTSKDLPEYACSPSPIRWSFLADSESKTPSDFDGATVMESHPDKSKKSDDHSRQKFDSPLARGVDREQSTTVIFHQEGEAFNNCCNNYLQCNAFLDQDLKVTNEDICEYLSKGNQGEVLNNTVNYPFQPSSTLEFHYKNNFRMSNNNSPNIRRNSNKETNLNQNNIEILPAVDTTMSPANINLSSSSNNINIIFNSYLENNANEVKFINTSRDNDLSSLDAHHNSSSTAAHYLPFTYPSSSYNNYNTNMNTSSLFDKPIGIDEIPSTSNHQNSDHHQQLHHPAAVLLNDSFDTSSSNHNLLYYRYSSNSDGQHNFELSPSSPTSPSSQSHHHRQVHCTHHKWSYITNNLKFGNALRKVRRRARKYTQYLRKK